MLAFLLSPLGRALASLAGVLVLSGVIYGKGRLDGSAATEARWREAVQMEVDRQIEEGQAAKRAEARRIAAIEAEIAERDRLIQELANEADADPTATAGGISRAGSVRLNRVR